MPYLLLALGLIIGFYALYRFFLSANIAQIKAFITAAVTIIICTALFFMAITGRLPAALALLGALFPIAVTVFKAKLDHKKASQAQNKGPMTPAEAREVLGVEEDAGQEDIKNAYKKLMQKVHPDKEGSEWMAAKLNEAKDLLLKK